MFFVWGSHRHQVIVCYHHLRYHELVNVAHTMLQCLRSNNPLNWKWISIELKLVFIWGISVHILLLNSGFHLKWNSISFELKQGFIWTETCFHLRLFSPEFRVWSRFSVKLKLNFIWNEMGFHFKWNFLQVSIWTILLNVRGNVGAHDAGEHIILISSFFGLNCLSCWLNTSHNSNTLMFGPWWFAACLAVLGCPYSESKFWCQYRVLASMPEVRTKKKTIKNHLNTVFCLLLFEEPWFPLHLSLSAPERTSSAPD